MSEQTAKPRPVETHRDGRLSAAIWANEGERGPIYNATFAYSYQDKNGNWRDSQSIPAHELLKAANLAQTAYTSVQRLKEQDRAAYVQRQREEAPGRSSPVQPRER